MQTPTRSLILIVDDEPIARETLAGLLQTAGYDLEFAADGRQALQQAQALRPDVILLDVMMPDMDGLEVCRRLRADPDLAEVPIFFITALDDRDSRLAGLRAGGDDFLTKPFDRLELQARLQTVTRLNRYRRLVAERSRFEWLVENASEGFVVLEADGRLQYANPRARLYLGLAPAPDALGQDFLDLARQQYHCQPESVWETWRSSRELPAPAFLVRPETPTARAFWLQVDVAGAPRTPAGGQLVALRDVTESLNTQHEMRVFHGTIMHKLRTPLVPMVGGLELINSMAESMPPGEVAALARMALGGVRRLQAEIDDILGYVNAPTLARPGDALAVADLPGHVQARAEEAGVSAVSVAVAPELARARLGLAREILDVILWEVLENARKFHPDGAPRVHVQVRPAGAGRLSLQVCDDGLTLSPEQLQWAWQPYLQGEKGYSGEMPGMGLGLARVAALVWQGGGQARLFNRPDGPGVVVELVLPLLG